LLLDCKIRTGPPFPFKRNRLLRIMGKLKEPLALFLASKRWVRVIAQMMLTLPLSVYLWF